jgi:hypothetical protein
MVTLTVLCAFLALAAAGCEAGSPGARSDPVLAGIAAEEGSELAATFSIPEPNMDDISIEWGQVSEYNNTDNYYRIKIREDLAGQDEALRCHVRHEIFHAMSGLSDGEQESLNGVPIASVVAWEA